MSPIKQGGPYKFTTGENFEDLSSGRVIYGATGASNFPVRLINEIFLRADYYLGSEKSSYTIYDPFCGSGYSLTVLGFLHPTKINLLIGSDVNNDMVEVAKKNLSLLTKDGMEKRINELKKLETSFGKDSHKEALASAGNLALLNTKVASKCFVHDALSDSKMPVDLKSVDLVISDLPYGKLTQWENLDAKVNPAQKFLNTLKKNISAEAVIALSFNKKQGIEYEGFKKLGSFKVGTRKILFLKQI